jgi:hypothetical protein
MERLKGISETHYVFTDNGWELLSGITIDTKILTCRGKTLAWQRQDKFTKFDFKGVLNQTSLIPSIYANAESLLKKEEHEIVSSATTKFFTKGYKPDFRTWNFPHKIQTTELVPWKGTLIMFSFPYEAQVFIFNNEEYIII